MGGAAGPDDRPGRRGLRATVSGRPPEIAGIESMVGLFINTLPVRVRLRDDESLAELFARVQDQSRLSAHQYTGLTDIRAAAGVTGELFDTLTVFENYPLDTATPGCPAPAWRSSASTAATPPTTR
ncbi:hypothetical protein GQS52_10595 [Streptomyces sp. SCUT-3]|uniref:condensation domain-containing protein n=1 Tax=Streptomyces sp. SCUT-3 TaxID=2684469 RepID=UPI0015FDCB3D|nr:condensation domain-containing protein [Streptomyces sp. SCUT-3]QMV22160.1 hypothetical protein GQS52_10595 [Streptomyces sp. SCUT-3]